MGAFDCLGHEDSIEPNLTSVVCLVQILQHLFKIAFSGKWGCFLLGASLLLRLCSFFLPHHIMEIAIKLEPGMLEKSAWAHQNCLDPRNRMHSILLPYYKGFQFYGNFPSKICRATDFWEGLRQLNFFKNYCFNLKIVFGFIFLDVLANFSY